MLSIAGIGLFLTTVVDLPAAARCDTPGDAFANRVMRRAGAVRTTCIKRIRVFEERMRADKPDSDFRVLCAELPSQTSDLERVRRAVRFAIGDLAEEGLEVVLEQDWEEHHLFGQSFSVTYSIADESVIVWWHPAMRLLELRVWLEQAESRAADKD